MEFTSLDSLYGKACELRNRLEVNFNFDTAYGGESGTVPSAGHCAVVSYIALKYIGGSLVSAVVDGKSHWFNRVRVGSKVLDLDLTGDQFGGPSVQIAEKGLLYAGERLREPQELTSETISRAKKLAKKAGIKSIDSTFVWTNK